MRAHATQSEILVVEAEEESLALICGVLGKAGFATRQAVSGDEALEAARKHRPRLVVLEVSLPDMCGYEVCRQLRANFGEDLPIMFVSGVRTEPFDRVAGLLIGADDYLTKPFSPDELVARALRLVRRSSPLASGVISKLTRREHEVLRLLAGGLGPREIGSRLFISEKTVGSHLQHIFAKLGVRNRTQAVALAFREDALSIPG
jgi:two-component system OmpR family response regulator